MTARKLMQNKGSGLLSRMMPKRNFNSKIDSMIERFLERLPNGNIGVVVAALNLAFYGAYVFWPKYSMHTYLNNFSFSLYGLNQGYIWNMFTCHFAHQSFFSFLIDSVIIYLLCQSSSMMYGPLFVAKTVLLSMFLGSFLLYMYHNSTGGMSRPF